MEGEIRFESMNEYPIEHTMGSGLARIVDGLGFRYYWATEGLTDEDFQYDPKNGGRTMLETLSHLYNMVDFAGRILEGKVTEFPEKSITWSNSQLRSKTLGRIGELMQLCMGHGSENLHERKVKVKVDGGDHEFPFWHFFNGPLVDAFWHLGQVASFRRSLGKPIDSKVEPFLGIRRDD